MPTLCTKIQKREFYRLNIFKYRGQESEDRGQRTEDRGQRTEDRGQRTEVRGFTQPHALHGAGQESD